MIPFIRYMTRYYARSYQYVAPLLFFLATILIVFSTRSSDVLGTYSFGAMWVFLVSAWLAYGYTRVEHGTQQQITVLKMRGIQKYLRAKLVFISFVAVVVACGSVVYPLIAHTFIAPVAGGDLLVEFVETMFCSNWCWYRHVF